MCLIQVKNWAATVKNIKAKKKMMEDEQNLNKNNGTSACVPLHRQKSKNAGKPQTQARKMYEKIQHLLSYS